MNARRIEILSQMRVLSDKLDTLILNFNGDDDEIEEIEEQLEYLEDELDMIDWEENNQ